MKSGGLKKVKSSEESFVEVPMELIDRPAVPDRIEIREGEISELADSIRERTMLVPIQVNEVSGRYEIVFGDRRFLACKKLGYPTIKAIVKRYSPEDVIIDRAVENLGRKNLSVIEEARTCLRLHEKAGLDWDKIGKRVGLSGGVVKRRVAILRMDEVVVDALHRSLISVGVAEEIARCGDVAHRLYLVELAIEHGVTVGVMRGWINDWIHDKDRQPVDVVEGGGVCFPGAADPIYRPCGLCKGAVDINEMVRIECCPDCGRAVMDIVQGKRS